MTEFFENRPSFKNLIGKLDLTGLEIGVASGTNAFRIMTNLSIKKLYLIDPWCGYLGLDGHGVIGDIKIAEVCYANTKKIMVEFGDKVQIIRGFSEDVVNTILNDLDFVYIDGNHRYEWVNKDIRNYYPKLKLGGQFAGHDFKKGEPGVKKAVEEYFGENYEHPKNSWDWWHVKNVEVRRTI